MLGHPRIVVQITKMKNFCPKPHFKILTIVDYVVVTTVTRINERFPKTFLLISKKVYLHVSKFSNRMVISKLSDRRSKTGIVNMSTPPLRKILQNKCINTSH